MIKKEFSFTLQKLKKLPSEGIPEHVDHFWCDHNELTSLEFGPRFVHAHFDCSNNKLTSLEFGPEYVGVDFKCFDNKLTSLEFCASKIGSDLICSGNNITHLKDIHKQFKNGYITTDLDLKYNPIKSRILGVILIPKLQEISVDNGNVQDILNNHLIAKDVLECQEELIQNGFKEFAQL